MLDVRAGQVVRAVRGERAAYRPVVSALAAGSAPLAIADALAARTGADVLYVADLDALQGGALQVDVLAALLADRPGRTLWVDAALRDARDAQALAGRFGARVRPVFGSESLRDAAALALAGAILSLDSRGGRPLDVSGIGAQPAAWPDTVIVMTLDRVGAAAGPDLDAFAQWRARAPDRRWIGAGGIRDASDLAAGAQAGAHGWLVASALHDGTLDDSRTREGGRATGRMD